MFAFIARRVAKIGGGHPGGEALRKMLDKADDDKGWFPGKSAQKTHGPAAAISPALQAVVARSAMAMHARGQEPTYARLVAACPLALQNPQTQEPVGKKRVYAIMKERCYDDPEVPEDLWTHGPRHSKQALTEVAQRLRCEWSLAMQGDGRTPAWYYKNLVWTDICNTILPRTEKRQQEMTLARKGKKGWGSPKVRKRSANLRGKAEALKQKSWDSIRVWWAPVLARGKLHLELLGEDFPGETPEGAAILVARVRTALNIRFQGTPAPRVLFTDRGQGFYRISGGAITPEYKAALSEHGLRAYYPNNATVQPGNLQDVLLHETAVAWVRLRDTVTQPQRLWKESVAEYGTRLTRVAQHINAKYDVEGLCRQLPKRLRTLQDASGDRLSY